MTRCVTIIMRNGLVMAMKHTAKISIWGVTLLTSFTTIVSATSKCDYETQIKLREEASNVKASYVADLFGTGEYEELEVPDEEGNTDYEIVEPLVKSTIYNITENLYVEVSNKNTGEKKTYTSKDLVDGAIRWETGVEDIIEYEIKVYSNYGDCQGEELYKIPLTTPKYNDHYGMTYCLNNKQYYCSQFITEEINMTSEQIEQQAYIDNNKKTQSVEEEKKSKSFWEQYGIYFGVAFGLLLIGGLTIVILNKKKRSKII